MKPNVVCGLEHVEPSVIVEPLPPPLLVPLDPLLLPELAPLLPELLPLPELPLLLPLEPPVPEPLPEPLPLLLPAASGLPLLGLELVQEVPKSAPTAGKRATQTIAVRR